MDRIRLGNDIEILWKLYTEEESEALIPYDLTGRDLEVSLLNEYGEFPVDFRTEGHRLIAMYRGKDQKDYGKYTIILRENTGEEGMKTIDSLEVFELVRHTAYEMHSGFHLTFESIVGSWSGTIDPILNHDAELAEAQRKANEEDRVAAELARRDEEAVRSVSELARMAAEDERQDGESVRMQNENLRELAEEEREAAEAVRKSSEAERNASEKDRIDAENNRIAAEKARQDAEAIRIANENERKQNESSRGNAEATRKANESKRISAESARDDAERKRIASENERSAAEVQRASAEAERKLSELERIAEEEARRGAEAARQEASAKAVALAKAAAGRANDAAANAEQKATLATEAAAAASTAAEAADTAAGMANEAADKFNAAIVQETGDSQDKAMSQKAVTDALTASDQKLSELEDRMFFNGQTIVTPTEKANLFWGGSSVQASSAGARYNGYVFELTEGVRTNTTGTLLSRYTFPSYPQVGDMGTNKTNANTEFVPTSSEKYMLVTFDGNIQPNDITFVTIREDRERNALESKVIDAQKDIKVISGVHENITIAPNARLSYFRKVEDRNISLRVIQHSGIATSFTVLESKDGVGTGAKVLATMKPSIPTSVVVDSDYPYIWIFNGDYQPNGASLTLEIYETNTIYQLTMGMRAMDGVGKKIVCLGDSITAFSDSKSKTYSDYLGEKIGCDAVCGGIGGTRLVARANVTSAPANLNEAWALLDIENLAKAWCNKDWANVDIASDMVISSGGNGVNQERNINNLKNTPITSANIVTIMGGTNDYAASISKEAIKTSLKAIVSTLLTANKTLEIYVISPIVRYVNASSAAQRTPDKWSDVFQNTNGDTLVDITECIREACKECHVNFIDLYDTLCWNQTNFSTFFIDTDSTHPYNGFSQIAEKIAKGLSK